VEHPVRKRSSFMKIPKASPDSVSLGWSVDYETLEEIKLKISSSESLALEQVEAVVLALSDMGYAELGPSKEGMFSKNSEVLVLSCSKRHLSSVEHSRKSDICRYPLDEMMQLIKMDGDSLNIEKFLESLEVEDRSLAAHIGYDLFEQYSGLRGTQDTLDSFRSKYVQELLRRGF
jgi:hypothetical protein